MPVGKATLVGFDSGPESGGVITLINLKALDNGTGVIGNNGKTYMSHVTIAGSTVNGYQASVPGVLLTFGDNYIVANNSNAGSLTPASEQ